MNSASETAAAQRSIREAGYAVLPGVFDLDELAAVRKVYDQGVDALIEACGGLASVETPANRKNRISVFPPLTSPFVDASIIARPTVLDIVSGTLGDDCHISLYNSNTSFPGSVYQKVHRDTAPIFSIDEVPVPLPAESLVLNIPLCDFTETNGSTEVWPGTHRLTSQIDHKLLASFPSVKLHAPLGSAIIRDCRMWHRGVPNHSDERRTMLAIVYSRGWLLTGPMQLHDATFAEMDETCRRLFRFSRKLRRVTGELDRSAFQFEPSERDD